MNTSNFRLAKQSRYGFDLRRSSLLEAIASRFFSQIEKGCLMVEFPSGHRKTFEGNTSWPQGFLKLYNFKIISRMFLFGDLGLAEGYIAGDWDTPQLAALLNLGNLNATAMTHALKKTWVARKLDIIRHAKHANTAQGSRRNISAHYDIGNAFYKIWLDKTMSYSSAIFEGPDESLEAAQRRKYLRLAEKLELKPGQQLLEIGCGWGGFAEIAATDFGCNVVGLTLSSEQAEFAKARMAQLGLTEKVEIRVQDYRNIYGTFDKVISIEMFEAVGEAYWSTYFNTLTRCLKPGGRAALQIITIDDKKFPSYKKDPEFIQRYIFPGGMLPGHQALVDIIDYSGFELVDSFHFGESYAETLRRWDQEFQTKWPDIKALGFNERFYRMWRYYLCYCEAGFAQNSINVGQYLIKLQ
ncbi:MAG: SAM-dependent methyltransferase [Magnetovibrio sp.]|nr:SAM-dependent methyltransferase [Magnetovibrio sp.]|tara:strand:- start:865 stop:2097 length:1233 start_codon:yes stop_codon:yes gene_type:complete